MLACKGTFVRFVEFVEGPIINLWLVVLPASIVPSRLGCALLLHTRWRREGGETRCLLLGRLGLGCLLLLGGSLRLLDPERHALLLSISLLLVLIKLLLEQIKGIRWFLLLERLRSLPGVGVLDYIITILYDNLGLVLLDGALLSTRFDRRGHCPLGSWGCLLLLRNLGDEVGDVLSLDLVSEVLLVIVEDLVNYRVHFSLTQLLDEDSWIVLGELD